MQIGEQVTTKVEKLLFGGDGLAHEGGCALFIPGGIPGETVCVEIVQVKKNYAEGKLLEVVCPSESRRSPPCPLFSRCGGCDLQQIDDAMQLRYKVESFHEVLARIGHFRDLPLAPAIASDPVFGYRFRIQAKVQGRTLGFYRRGSHDIVPVRHCPISHPLVNRGLARFSDLISEGLPSLSSLREIQLLVSDQPEQILATFFLDRADPEGIEPIYRRLKEEIPLAGWVLRGRKTSPVFGRDFVSLSLLGDPIRISAGSFIQANWKLNERIVGWTLEALEIQKTDRILELYSGIGNFTLSFARRAGSVVAVEGSRTGVRDAKFNLKTAGLRNVQLLQGSARWALPRLQGRFDRIFLDPPRSGAGEDLLHLLPKGSRRIVYLSCYPATLARDLRLLVDLGWGISALQPFDMFPQTGHLEVGAVLEKRS